MQVVVVANSTNKTWLSSADLENPPDNSLIRVDTPTSTGSTLDRRLKGRKLDDSEVFVYSPSSYDNIEAGDTYEESKNNKNVTKVLILYSHFIHEKILLCADLNISHISVIAVEDGDGEKDRSSPSISNVSSVVVHSNSGMHIHRT